MKKLKRIISIVLITSMILGFHTNTLAGYFFSDSDVVSVFENFKKNDKAALGASITEENGKTVFGFSPRNSTTARTPYLYKQNLEIKETLCIDMKLEFSDISKAMGTILLRNYHSGMGYYNLVGFSGGKMSFATGGSCDIPTGEFRVRIYRSGNTIAMYVNGIEMSDGNVASNFNFSDLLEIRVEFSDALLAMGEEMKVYLDDLKIFIDTISSGLTSVNQFRIKESASTGATVTHVGNNYNLNYSARTLESARTAYIYRQDMSVDNILTFEAGLNISVASAVGGSILLRNYYSGKGFYDLVTFKNGKMTFVTGGNAVIPSGEFKLKIHKTDNILKFYIDGELKSSGEADSAFSFDNPLELRAEFNDSGLAANSELKICINNPVITLSEPQNMIYPDTVKYYTDYGRERIKAETTLDPYEVLTASVNIANLGDEAKDVLFISKNTFDFVKETIDAGSIKNFTLYDYDGSVDKNDTREYFIWDGNFITPLSAKQNISNDGVVVPTIADIKSMMSQVNCGQIWLTKSRIAEMKSYLDLSSSSYDEEFAKLWTTLVAKGDSILKDAPTSYGTALGVQPANRVYDRVALLSVLYLVSEDEKYAERAYREMSAAASFPDWHDIHFLDTAALLTGLSVGYDALYDYLTDDQKTEISNALYTKGLLPALKIYRDGNDTWETRKNNWNIICNSSVAMASLVLGANGKYTDDCAEALNTALRDLRLAYASFTEAGSWNEGMSYWGYMLKSGVDLLYMLDNSFGTDFGYSQIENFKKSPYFSIAMSGSYIYNYDDCEPAAASTSPLMYYFAEINNDMSLAKYHTLSLGNGNVDCRDAMWYRSEYNRAELADMNEDFYDPDAKLFSFRDNFEDNTFLAFNAGCNLGTHTQLDMGSFVYDMGGVRWFEDLGIDNYSLYNYLDYNGYKWYYYRNRAEGHNCMVFDTGAFDESNVKTAPDQVVDSEGEVTEYNLSDSLSYAVLDISSAYAPSCNSYERTLILDKDIKAVAISDAYSIKSLADSYWFAHTKADIEITENGKAAILTQSVNGAEKKLYVKIVSDWGAFEAVDALPLGSSPDPDSLDGNISAGLTQNKNLGYSKLRIKETQATGEYRLCVAAIDYENKSALDSFISKTESIIE